MGGSIGREHGSERVGVEMVEMQDVEGSATGKDCKNAHTEKTRSEICSGG